VSSSSDWRDCDRVLVPHPHVLATVVGNGRYWGQRTTPRGLVRFQCYHFIQHVRPLCAFTERVLSPVYSAVHAAVTLESGGWPYRNEEVT